MEKDSNLPAIVWLKVTDYVHGWLTSNLLSQVHVGQRGVVCLMHLPEVRQVMRMATTTDDATKTAKPGNSMSAMMHNIIEAGLEIDEQYVRDTYAIDKEAFAAYVPIEAPELCCTEGGVMRPWKPNTVLGRQQANELLRVLRNLFWKAVEQFNEQYNHQHHGKYYSAAEMLEAWCTQTCTPDTYIDAMRREWQRRQKRSK